MSTVVPNLLAIAWVVVSGCALNDAGRREVAAVLEQQAQSRGETAANYARTSAPVPAGSDRQPPAGEVDMPASLRDYIVLALAENPEIKAAEESARAKAERIAQFTVLPDPMIATKSLAEPVRTADGDNTFVLGVSQMLPVPEKLDRAGRVALEETRMAVQRLQEIRLSVIGDVKRAYFQLYVLDKTIKVTRENQELMRGLIDVARAQVAAGRRPQDDALRAQVETSNLESELIALRQQRVTEAARLNHLLNRPTMTAVPTPENFDIRRTALVIDNLLTKATDANPVLEQLRTQIERDRHTVELARLAYWPDVTIGFEWMYMRPRNAFEPPRDPQTGQRPPVDRMSKEGMDSWAVTLDFNLPVWFEKIEAGIEEARRTLASSEREYVAAKNRVSFQITDALERVRSQQELAVLFRDTIIPQAEQTYRVSQGSYSAGASDFLYVIDNWQRWLIFTIQYHRTLGELEGSVADLEQALGLSLAEAGAIQ